MRKANKPKPQKKKRTPTSNYQALTKEKQNFLRKVGESRLTGAGRMRKFLTEQQKPKANGKIIMK